MVSLSELWSPAASGYSSSVLFCNFSIYDMAYQLVNGKS